MGRDCFTDRPKDSDKPNCAKQFQAPVGHSMVVTIDKTLMVHQFTTLPKKLKDWMVSHVLPLNLP